MRWIPVSESKPEVARVVLLCAFNETFQNYYAVGYIGDKDKFYAETDGLEICSGNSDYRDIVIDFIPTHWAVIESPAAKGDE